jgi:putative ABC transport system ATP-binding protein
MLRLENISVKFNDELILDNFSMKIEEGEHICLWGPSGSGKTTILKLITGVINPSEGKIYFQDKLVDETSIAELRRNIAWIPQNINLPSKNGNELSGLINLQPDKTDRIFEKLDSLGLDKSFFTRNFSEISIGQKQRVIIAIALSMNRKILLLDEPTSALDQESVNMLIDAVFTDPKLTILSASHDHSWAEANDRVMNLI